MNLVLVLGLALHFQAQDVIDHAKELHKVFEDARFWIEIEGRRTGWVRWQVARGEDRGESCHVIDYERANYMAHSERYRMLVRINEYLTPIQFKYGEAYREFRIENGKIGRSPFGAPKDPGNLVSFPELLATLFPFKAGFDLKFSTTDHDERLHADGSIKYEGAGKLDGVECQKFKASFTTKPGNVEERNEMELWVRPDRRIAKVAVTVAWTSGSGKKGRRSEEWVPVDPKEWASSTIESNELRALAQLSALGDMLLVQRANDFDANSQFDEWVGDISGLFRSSPVRRSGRFR